jgi:hypothetical protein
MQTMEQSLADLVMRRVITPEVGFNRSSRPDQLHGILERAGYVNLPTPKNMAGDALDLGAGPDSGLRLAGQA